MYPRPENVKFCDSIISAPIAPNWQASGNTGHIMVGMVGFTPTYAEMRSDMLGGEAGQVATPPGSAWRMLRGRWPLQSWGSLQLAAWATWVVLERRVVGAFDRKRVYLLDESTPVQAATTIVSIWQWGNNVPAGPLIVNPGQNKYRETQLVGGAEQVTGDLMVPAPDDGNFIATLVAYANLKNFNLIG